MTAKDVIKLLAAKHAEDVFVPECKDGPTQSRDGHLRLDAWVMKRSWAHPLTIGYEVKVSRGDFVQDNKWTGYLPLCNQFYFVAPKGIIRTDELPAEVGLLEVLGTKRLAVRKKSPHREVPLDECLARYILMCRATIQPDLTACNQSEFWRAWLADRAERRELGYRVSRAIRDHVQRVEGENRFLKEQNNTFADVRNYLGRLGISPDKYVSMFDVERKTEAARQAVPDGLLSKLYDLTKDLGEFKSELDKLKGTP